MLFSLQIWKKKKSNIWSSPDQIANIKNLPVFSGSLKKKKEKAAVFQHYERKKKTVKTFLYKHLEDVEQKTALIWNFLSPCAQGIRQVQPSSFGYKYQKLPEEQNFHTWFNWKHLFNHKIWLKCGVETECILPVITFINIKIKYYWIVN